MPRNKNNDCPLGAIITSKLKEMERSQMWLARKVERAPNTINEIIKGRQCPPISLLKSIANTIDIDCMDLVAAVIEKEQ